MPQVTIATFLEYDLENFRLWKLFEHLALQAAQAGRKNFGAKAIMERIRWYTTIERPQDDEYKICNSWTSFYARKFALKHPRHADLFQYRRSIADGLTREHFDEHWLPRISGRAPVNVVEEGDEDIDLPLWKSKQ